MIITVAKLFEVLNEIREKEVQEALEGIFGRHIGELTVLEVVFSSCNVEIEIPEKFESNIIPLLEQD